MAKTAKVFSFLLRLLALAASAAAAIVMATSHENRTFFNIQVHAKYHHTPAFKVFVIVNAIAAGYSLLVLFLPSKSSLRRLVLLLDVMVTMLLTGAISAALAVGYIGKKGNSYAGWLPICNQLSKFCDHVTVALIIGFGTTFIYLFLLLHTIHTVLNPLIS